MGDVTRTGTYFPRQNGRAQAEAVVEGGETMKALFLRWVHDRRGVYQDEGMLVLLLTAVSLFALVHWLSDSGLLSRSADILMGVLSSILR